MKQRIVMKFGGTSLGSVASIQRAVGIIQKHTTSIQEIIVVVSAAAGVTNILSQSILQAYASEKGKYTKTLSEIRSKLEEIAAKILQSESARKEFSEILAAYVNEAQRSCSEISNHKGRVLQLEDRILSIGERIQVHLIAAALNQQNVQAIPLEASDFILTNDAFQEARPLQPITDQKINAELSPHLQAGVIPIITGFIGATTQGQITTLGRGGSDYSAAIIAVGLKANEVWIWTDVDGMMTTDPALDTKAQLISEISYHEVYDLAFFGARVLHPNTILPCEENNIPVRIKNTFNEKNQGTFIHFAPKNNNSHIKAVTGFRQINILSVRKRGSEEISKLIEYVEKILEEAQFQVLGTFQGKDQNKVYLAINRTISEEQLDAFEMQLAKLISGRSFSRLRNIPGHTLITAVGHRIQRNLMLSSKLRIALEQAGIAIQAESYRNTLHSLSFLIDEQDHLKAIQQLHNEVLSYAAI